MNKKEKSDERFYDILDLLAVLGELAFYIFLFVYWVAVIHIICSPH
jgi:hypothetical protein